MEELASIGGRFADTVLTTTDHPPGRAQAQGTRPRWDKLTIRARMG
jgi:hypothetical protein